MLLLSNAMVMGCIFTDRVLNIGFVHWKGGICDCMGVYIEGPRYTVVAVIFF